MTAARLPSVFDARNKERIAELYEVPGTPITIRMRDNWGRDCFVIYENGVENEAMRSELLAEFRGQRRTAETFQQIGHRIRARYQ